MGNNIGLVAEYVTPKRRLMVDVNCILLSIHKTRRHIIEDRQYKTMSSQTPILINKLEKKYEDLYLYIMDYRKHFEDPIIELLEHQEKYISYLHNHIYTYDTDFSLLYQQEREHIHYLREYKKNFVLQPGLGNN